jgi:peptidoglycan/xylan/chitin deacetylase (PgdA/CDA1 family)
MILYRIAVAALVTALPPLLIAGCSHPEAALDPTTQPAEPVVVVPLPDDRPWTFDHGAPIRGDVARKQLALIFTGGEYGEGAAHILDELARRKIHAGFFLTGDFLRDEALRPLVERMIAEGHYVGPHSDAHLLYCPWEDRSKTLVTADAFKADLAKNIADIRALGGLPKTGDAVCFIPPFEWFNDDQVRWSREMGVLLFNFTPGSGSNRDYAPEGHRSFVA